MEMRSLTRTLLRARPTPLSTTQPSSILLRGQFLTSQRSLRFSSTDNSPSDASTTTTNTTPSANTNDSDLDQIIDKLNLNSTTTPQSSTSTSTPDINRAVGAAMSPVMPQRKVAMKLGPSLGRQVAVEPERGVDLASSLRILQSTCHQNRVRQDVYTQKYHVRRGQVRKNLRVVRWRKLFKYSFQHTVARIDRMRAQGW